MIIQLKLGTHVPRNNAHVYTKNRNSGFNDYLVISLFHLRKKQLLIDNIIIFDDSNWFMEFKESILNCINPFLHIDAFWRLCSRQLFENIVTKEDIVQNKQFLLLQQCFPLLIICYPFNYRDFLFFDKIWSYSSAAELSNEGKG